MRNAKTYKQCKLNKINLQTKEQREASNLEFVKQEWPFLGIPFWGIEQTDYSKREGEKRIRNLEGKSGDVWS